MAESLALLQSNSSGKLPLPSSSRSSPSSSNNMDIDNPPQFLTFDNSPGPTILDFSYTGMDTEALAEALTNQPENVFSSVESILATNNSILQIPEVISKYHNLRLLDLSSNQMSDLPECLTRCQSLVTLICRNNLLDKDSLPKNFKRLTSLRELNLSGNRLTRIPYEILECQSIQNLHLGGNRVEYVPQDIANLKRLEVLYLGGNMIRELPSEVGELKQLRVFVLCDNRIESLPKSISTLKQLKSLLLHRNQLTYLPVELIKLRNLMELSLRDNPLVHKFVKEMTYAVPTLLELSGRTIKLKKIPFKHSDIPKTLQDYLRCAHQCVNPRCKGVFFDGGIEHIKFVDFCGKYRVPLLEYLCSPNCSDNRVPTFETSDSDSDEDKMRKVLLG